ncbi:MAG TPA: ferredoxin [Micromonosporaceae bacterium]|jgi:ferredoxin
MNLHIDWTACDGRGLCVEMLPELLTTDDWDYPLVRDGGGAQVRVPAGLVKHAHRAAAHCPMRALTLTPG